MPAFPPLVYRLQRLVNNSNSDLGEISMLIPSDPALAAEVLRLSNSPLFCGRHPVGSINHAIVLLGLDRVRSAALTVGISDLVRGAVALEPLRRCWRHNFACALVAEALAEPLDLNRDHAYSAGLIHDIGRLAMIYGYPKEYARMVDETDRDGLPILDEERRAFEMDHCEAGEYILRQWRLPEILQQVARHHHEAPQGKTKSLVGLIQLSCRVADELGFQAVGEVRECNLDRIEASLPAELPHYSEADWRNLTEQIVIKINSVECQFT